VLLVGAVNVGDTLCIGPISVDWGAMRDVRFLREGACCLVGPVCALLYCVAVEWLRALAVRAECVSECEVRRWSAACWSPIRPVLEHGPRSSTYGRVLRLCETRRRSESNS
jgi:hypothetical protein